VVQAGAHRYGAGGFPRLWRPEARTTAGPGVTSQCCLTIVLHLRARGEFWEPTRRPLDVPAGSQPTAVPRLVPAPVSQQRRLRRGRPRGSPLRGTSGWGAGPVEPSAW
jgi:hypothetical protein